MNEALARLHAIDVAGAGLRIRQAGQLFRPPIPALDRSVPGERDGASRGHGAPHRLARGQGSRRRRWPRRAGAWRLAHRQHDLRLELAASACGPRLGVVDPRSSARRSCLPVHAMAAPERPVSRLGRRRPRRERHPTEAEYVAAYCRRMGLEAIPDWTFLIAFSFFAASRSTRASTSVRSTATPRIRSSRGSRRVVPFVAHIAWEGVEAAA